MLVASVATGIGQELLQALGSMRNMHENYRINLTPNCPPHNFINVGR